MWKSGGQRHGFGDAAARRHGLGRPAMPMAGGSKPRDGDWAPGNCCTRPVLMGDHPGTFAPPCGRASPSPLVAVGRRDPVRHGRGLCPGPDQYRWLGRGRVSGAGSTDSGPTARSNGAVLRQRGVPPLPDRRLGPERGGGVLPGGGSGGPAGRDVIGALGGHDAIFNAAILMRVGPLGRYRSRSFSMCFGGSRDAGAG